MTLTLQAVQDKLGVWVPQVQGKYINEDWNPTNEGFGAQCWDLAANWSKFLGLPVINTGYPGRWVGWAGNMVDAYPQTPAIGAAYELIPPTAPGLPGDIVVWGDSYREYYPATHVAVLIKDPGGSLLLCASQNSSSSRVDNPYPKWSSGPATIQHLPRRGLIGFLRPRTTGGINYQGTITSASEEDDVTTPEQIETIVTAANKGSQAVGDQVFKRLKEELPALLWAYKNGEGRDAYQILRDIPSDTWKTPTDYRNPVTGELVVDGTTPETVLSYFDTNVSRILEASSPTEIANLVPEAFVEEVSRLLTERLAK